MAGASRAYQNHNPGSCHRYNQWYKLVVDMKTAISVDEHLLTEADRFARETGLSRSRLFSLALEAYLRCRRQEEMTDQLNRVYADESGQADTRTTKRMKAKFRSTVTEKW